MAYPSVSYVFVNATTASATEVNQNFTDLINGMSDGTKDLNISAITAAGTATFNGAVNLGNATGDDVSVNGYVATSVLPKTDNTYDLGSSGQSWKDGYFDGTLTTATLTVTGTANLNGPINLGNATGDDITATGYFASALIPKTDDTYDLGTAALAWQDAYFDGKVYVDNIAELTASATITFDNNTTHGVKNSIGALYTINDDNYTSFTPGASIGVILISGRADGYKDVAGMISYRTGSGNYCYQLLDPGGFITPFTGALTGTAGTDGQFNVSTHTDGKIYLENRIGTTVSVHVIGFGV